MRSLKQINKKITNINQLRVGNYYVLYVDDDKLLLFRFKECCLDLVYDDLCWHYIENKYLYGVNATLRFSNWIDVRLASEEEIEELT